MIAAKEAETVALDQIVWNPWRDMELYPINEDHVRVLQRSIRRHGFFGVLKGRRRNGVVEIAYGHHRIAAARKEGLRTVLVDTADMDDDQMILAMVAENALQAPGATVILREVEAVLRRLVTILLEPSQDLASVRAECFPSEKELKAARRKLLGYIANPDKQCGLGWQIIMRYLGYGDEHESSRSRAEISESIIALKQSGRYYDIIDDQARKHGALILDRRDENDG